MDKRFLLIVTGVIFLIHAVLVLAGFGTLDLTGYVQIIPFDELRRNFWTSLLYYHGNPPGLSLLHYAAQGLFRSHAQAALGVCLALLHAAAFVLFYGFLENRGFRFRRITALVLFLNPLLFLYFKYPFYSSLLFFSACAILRVLYAPLRRGDRLVLLAGLLAFNAFFRATWHILIIALFLIPFVRGADWKRILIAGFLLLAPLSVYVKNAAVFGRFTASTWLWHNIAKDHLLPESGSLRAQGVLADPSAYASFIRRDDPRLERLRGAAMLSRDDNEFYRANHLNTFLAGETFRDELKEKFSLRRSFHVTVRGIMRLFSSPAGYDHFTDPATGRPILLFGRCVPDIFHLPRFERTLPFRSRIVEWISDYTEPARGGRVKYAILLSVYLFVYPVALLVLLLAFRRLAFEERWLLLLTLFFLTVYAVIDPIEACRRRMEVEPFLYALTIFAIRGMFRSRFRP
jgi:hypothetical protein